ncbi:RNA recognition motif 2-domain-containing protein [Apodospora peruviana]|uniref:RNA recognition motif 2-domain-containing protein n=1 Tax=Apodospora peruviana TaxID=516989 RepID=A0AAE0M881_9PEZI|nr:RNA recognition motif 2-domain-containing protein [Apodospora peruviana]
MAQARETAFNPSSPHSSSAGADSYKHDGTPDTRLTAFSPDESSARSNKLMTTLSLNAAANIHPVRFNVNAAESYGAGSAAAEKDPFISKPEQKLSPTASAFRPISVPLVAHGSQNGMPGLNLGLPNDFQLLGLHNASKLSTELRISRYLVLFSASKAITVANVDDYMTNLERFGSSCQGKRHVIPEGNKVYLRFSNIRDARNVHDHVHLGGPDWCANYISPTEFYQVANPGVSTEAVSEGQVYVIALPLPNFDVGPLQIEAVVHGFLHGEGDIFAFKKLSDLNGHNGHSYRGLVEFSDVDVAVAVASKLNGISVNGIQLLLTLFQPDIALMMPEPPEVYGPPRAPMNDFANMFQNMSLSKTPQPPRTIVPVGRHHESPLPFVPQQQVAMYPVLYQTIQGPPRYLVDQTPTRRPNVNPPTPLTPLSPGHMQIMSPIFSPPATPMTMQSEFTSPRSVQPYGRPDSRRQNAMRVSRSPYYNAAGHHNHVDVSRIREGIDVRTTIMLRNIPNKVDQAMLKRIVDESSWGKYDFMYLRIDFANDCNVGYAFINFVDPLDIIDFVNARGNQRWNCFKSDKVAEISYATIQGKDCLVQKFRNSSVMLEAPHYRPKLYFTSNGPRPDLAGEEETFPEPDNQSKMKRSCENAEHVGLFTPNAGQHFRDEQRRRRSQYDRGTRLAALEEYDYDSHIQQPGMYPA